MFTLSAASRYFTILAAYRASVVSITRQPFVLAILSVMSHLPLFIQSSKTESKRPHFTNIWYFSIASNVISSPQYALLPNYERVAGIGIETTLAIGSESLHPHLHVR